MVKIPKTPPEFKKEFILERRRLYEKNEGEVNLKKSIKLKIKVKLLLIYYFNI